MAGAVVNRPSEHGFSARLDPLEFAAAGVAAPPRAVVLNDASAPGREVCRIPEWTVVDPDAPRSRFDVVRIGAPGRTRRFLVAGAEVFEAGGTGRRLDAVTAERVAPIVAWIRSRGTMFADFRVELEAGIPRLADVSCWPGHDLFPDFENQVYAALLAGLVP